MIQIHWTAEYTEEAKKIARELIAQKLVACANIFPHIESIYVWEGAVQESGEIKVVFTTLDPLFSKVCEYIEAHSSYEVPAIVKISIAEANPSYQNWVVDCVESGLNQKCKKW